MINPFQYKSESEIKGMIEEFFSDCEYMVKLRILLKAYPGYSITKLEARNINKLWKSLSINQKKDIYQDQHRYQI
ncbi:hypothetical protein ES695_16225 [Candidatus Atribacteria bacterium 1244-E10-H5-B2]|nr:MAG: hypothetical protein ES695_16225 [Candidatus Atribacteria bacterium 1244-E10-H5-B2]